MRRRVLLAGLSLLLSPRRGAGAESPSTSLASLERRSGGRLGVAIFDASSGNIFGRREHERFAICSTFKLIAAAAVLQRVDRGEEELSRFVRYGPSDLLEYAPVARAHVAEGGMSLGDLCAAAVGMSDNTAGNLLLATLGGPPGLTRFCRSLGDPVTRLDRTDPDLNVVGPNDVRDTTTPAAMLALLRAILLGRVLSDKSRTQLESWLVEAKIGADRLPAGLPRSWRAGHKTGTGPHGEANDVAIAWSPRGAPLLICAFYNQPDGSPAQRSAVLAETARIAARGR